MSMQNYTIYQSEFTSDTGLDWKTNVDTFIQYCQARILDKIMAQQQDLLSQVVAQLNQMHP
jgi:hypothetical protein